MLPSTMFHAVIVPTLDWMASVPEIKTGNDARAKVWTMTVSGQETNWQHRLQIGGPARSYWQFEKTGGVADLFRMVPTKLKAVCDANDIPFNATSVFEAMAWHDVLGCAMARLLLWTDPNPLPDVADVEGGWNYYLRNWRPGAPHHETWAIRHATAISLLNQR